MRDQHRSKLSHRKKYLQVAFNSTLSEARSILRQLPATERIIIEAGTPLIKQYGMEAIRALYRADAARLSHGAGVAHQAGSSPAKKSWAEYFVGEAGLGEETRANLDAFSGMLRGFDINIPGLFGVTHATKAKPAPATVATGRDAASGPFLPYIIADMKTMDRGATEVEMVAQAGGSAVIALGSAPLETLNAFVAACHANGLDAMIDMMNVEYPVNVLRKLKTPPDVVIVHRGVDEERDNREKQLPLHEIRRIKGNFDTLVSVAGGDTPREVQRAVFNDADIVVIWKSVYHQNQETLELVEGFLKNIK